MSDWIPIGDPVPAPLTPTQQRIRELLLEGKTPREISWKIRMAMDFLREEIFEIRKWEGLMGKLDNTQKAAIYQSYKDGIKPGELAQQYGVSVQAIYNAINKLQSAEASMKLVEAQNKVQEINLGTCDVAEVAEAAEKKRVATINEEFEAAVNEMIAESKAADAEAESEPEQIKEKLPPVVRRAIDSHLEDIGDHILCLQNRIEDIKAEIAEWEKDAKKLREWRDEQKW